MYFLANDAKQLPVNVIDLANAQKISPTYLSKILTKLAKEGLIKGSSGANGGYTLRKNWEAISFLDIIQAIEGKESIFECYVHEDPECTIKQIMYQAEELMENYLKSQTLEKLSR